MKAAILVEQNEPLVIADLDLPSLGVGQVLVKISYAGICGKQIEEINGKRGEDPYIPHLLGHEGAGIVEDVGPGVTRVKSGDHVVIHWIKGLGIDSAPPRFDWAGKTVSAGWATTFSEYTIVSENRATVIPEDMPHDSAALLGCAVTTGLGIIFNNARMIPGQSVAVFGAGGVGINVIQGASLINAHPIVAVDVYDHKLEQALAFGATHTLNASTQDVLASLKEWSGSNGLDVTIDTTGNTKIRQTAYQSTQDQGLVVFAGVPHHEDTITVDSFPLHFGRRMIGSHGGDTNPDADIPRYIRLFKLGKLKLKEQITHRFSLDNVNQGLDAVRKGEAGRCVISF